MSYNPEETYNQTATCANEKCKLAMSFPLKKGFVGVVQTTCPACNLPMEIQIEGADDAAWNAEAMQSTIDRKKDRKDKKDKKEKKDRKDKKTKKSHIPGEGDDGDDSEDEDMKELDVGDDAFPHFLRLEKVRCRCDCKGTVTGSYGDEVDCANHDVRCFKTDKLGIACITCRKLYCRHCSLEVHQNPVFESCKTIPTPILLGSFKLFYDISNTANTLVSCKLIADKADEYFPDSAESAQTVRRVAAKMLNKFGDGHSVNFQDFLTQYVAFLDTLSGKHMAGAQGEIDAVNERFRRLGRCGRWLFDQQLWWRYSSESHFPIWRAAISAVEASHSANVAHYFRFLRWTVFINIMISALTIAFLIIPSLWQQNWSNLQPYGAIIGTGLENSFFFFGGYLSLYSNGWQMDTAWILVQAGILVFSLFVIMSSIEASSLQDEDERLSGRHKLLSVLIGGLDFNAVDDAESKRRAESLRTNIDVTLILKRETLHKRVPRPCCSQIFEPYYIFFVLSLIVIAANTYGVYFASVYDQIHVIGTTNHFEYLLIPAIISVSKSIAPPILKFFAVKQYSEKYFRNTHRLTAYFWRLVILRIAYVIMISLALISNQSAQYLPTATQSSGLFCQYCGNSSATVSLTNCASLTSYVCECAETSMGILFYRIVLVDIFLAIVGPMLLNPIRVCFRGMCISCGCIKYQPPTAADVRSSNVQMTPVARDRYGRPVQLSPPQRPVPQKADPQAARLKEQASRNEFDPMANTADVIYRQMLLWSGVPYSPTIPIVLTILSVGLFYSKMLEVRKLSVRPHLLNSVRDQISTVRLAMIVVILVSFVPFTIFMIRTTSCGPFYYTQRDSETFSQAFSNAIYSLPNGINAIVGYITNTVILWMVLISGIIYVLTMRRQIALMADRREDLSIQIQSEQRERARLIKQLKIDSGENESNKNLYKEWVDSESNELIAKYAPSIKKREPDFLNLLRMRDVQLANMLKNLKIPQTSAMFIIQSLERRRMMSINAQQRKL